MPASTRRHTPGERRKFAKLAGGPDGIGDAEAAGRAQVAVSTVAGWRAEFGVPAAPSTAAGPAAGPAGSALATLAGAGRGGEAQATAAAPQGAILAAMSDNVVRGGSAVKRGKRSDPEPADPKMMSLADGVKHEMRLWLDVGKVPMVWGDVGGGKTTLVRQMCAEEGVELINMDLTTISEQAMITGLPGLKYDEATDRPLLVRVYEEQFERLRQLSEAEARGEQIPATCLFFDEITAAEDDLQAAVLNLFSHRTLGQWTLPTNCWMIGAGNSPEHSAHAQDLHEAARNRLKHIDMPEFPWPDTRSWIESQLEPGAEWHDRFSPEEKDAIREWAIVVDGFHMHHPGVYESQGNRDARDKAGQGFATPRAFTDMILALAANETSGRVTDPAAFHFKIANACLGRQVATAFASYAKSVDLPDPRDWLADPKLAEAFAKECAEADPPRHDRLSMVMQRMHSVIAGMPVPAGYSDVEAMQWRQDNAVAAGAALVEVGRAEFAQTMAAARFKSLMETPEFRNAPVTDEKVQQVVMDGTKVFGKRLLRHLDVVKAVMAEAKGNKKAAA